MRKILAAVFLLPLLANSQETTYRFTVSLDGAAQAEGFIVSPSPFPPNLTFVDTALDADLLTITEWSITYGGFTFTPQNAGVRIALQDPANPRLNPFIFATDADGLPSAVDTTISVISPAAPHQQGDIVTTILASVSTVGLDFFEAGVNVVCTRTAPVFFSNPPDPLADEICGDINSAQDDVEKGRLVITWSRDESGVRGCDQFEGKLGGICNAYCEGVNCDEDDGKKSCGVLAENFVKFGGESTVPPCGPPTGG